MQFIVTLYVKAHVYYTPRVLNTCSLVTFCFDGLGEQEELVSLLYSPSSSGCSRFLVILVSMLAMTELTHENKVEREVWLLQTAWGF